MSSEQETSTNTGTQDVEGSLSQLNLNEESSAEEGTRGENRQDEEEEYYEEEEEEGNLQMIPHGGHLDDEEEEEEEDEEDDDEYDEYELIDNPGLELFLLLDDNTVLYIFSLLDLVDLVRVSEVCKAFHNWATYDALWLRLYENTRWRYFFSYSSQNLELDWRELYVDRYLKELDKEQQGIEPDQIDGEFFGDENYDEEEEEDEDDWPTLGQDMDDYGTSVDEVLRSGEFDLVDLLLVDDFLSELQRGKPILLQYVKLPESMTRLLDFMLVDSQEVDEENHVKNRLAHISFQALNNDWLLEVLVATPELMDVLFSFLRNKTEFTEPLKSGYFAKITEVLLERFPNELVSHMSSRPEIAVDIISHCNDQYIMGVLYKMVDAAITHQWFYDCNVIPLMVKNLHESDNELVQENIAQVLVNLFALCQPWAQSIFILDLFSNEKIITQLLEFLSTDDTTGLHIKIGLNIMISMLNLLVDERVDDEPCMFIKAICGKLVYLMEHLKAPLPDPGPLTTSFGVVHPPFGSTRLKIVEFFSALMYTGYPIILKHLCDLNVFSVCLDLFFQYQWCNMLHHQVDQIVTTFLSGGDMDSLPEVIVKCNLVERIIKGFERAAAEPIGYTGQLLRIANELLRAAEVSPGVQALLDGSPGWANFCDTTLEETNRLFDTPICGGVPSDESEEFDDEFPDYYYPEEDEEAYDEFDNNELICEDEEEEWEDFDEEDSQGYL